MSAMKMTPNKNPPEGPVSEATLMRFVDGDLPPREHAFVADLVAAHPEELRSVEAYRFTKEQLPEAFVRALHVPPELMRRCLPARRLSLLAPRTAAWALAASVAMLLAGASGWLLRAVTHEGRGDFTQVAKGIAAPPSLQRALETTLTGEFAKLAANVSLKPMSTFPSLEKRWCRQYALDYADATRASGLACRDGDGIWRIGVQSAPQPFQQRDRSRTVAAGTEEDAVANYRDQILGGNVLSKDHEEQLIRNERWARRP